MRWPSSRAVEEITDLRGRFVVGIKAAHFEFEQFAIAVLKLDFLPGWRQYAPASIHTYFCPKLAYSFPERIQPVRTVVYALFLLPLFVPASGQTTKYEDVTGRKGIEERYDPTEDLTSIATKRDVMDSYGSGTRRYSVAISILCTFPGHTADLSKTVVTMIMAPDRVPRRSSDNLNFLLNAELSVTADGQQFSGKTQRYERKTAYIFLPIENFREIVTAKKLEITIGNIELKILPRHRERWKDLLAELIARQTSH
ncbi:MAG: hypothetical protein ACREA2_02705 [Blastocatellia bacterium]